MRAKASSTIAIVVIATWANAGVASVGDCDNNGTLDAQEAAWANRDDDADGVCNGVDNCPDETNADQAATACQMQAITVPGSPLAAAVPHPTYSGATITLKGLARYGGNQFMWDFGDGTAPTAWMPIADPYDLGVTHQFSGAVGTPYAATLSVRDSAQPAVVATATYRVQIGSSSDISDPSQLLVRAAMGIDESLWWLHVHQTRATAADGATGYRQAVGSWSTAAAGCAAVDAFERHGSLVSGDRRSDPYVEDVRRGLNQILAGAGANAIPTQLPAGSPFNPDVNANGIGVHLAGTSTTQLSLHDGVCALALSDSAAPDRRAATGSAGVYDRSYKSIAQDAAEWFFYGQVDNGIQEGAWGSSANNTPGTMNNTAGPILAIVAAESRMTAIVPAVIRSELLKFVTYDRFTAADQGNGAWGYAAPGDVYKTISNTSTGIAGLRFLGQTATDFRVKTGLGFIYRDWNGIAAYQAQNNVGDSFTMYLLSDALRGLGIQRVVEYDYIANTQTGNSFDWFFTPTGQAQVGYATWLVTHQNADGSWPGTNGLMGADAGFPTDATAATAFNAAILTGALTACGNGTVDAGEMCDLGTSNGAPSACCTSTCQLIPNGGVCDDGSACTQTDACQSGTCVGSNPVVCTASDQCHAVGTCSPATGVCTNPAATDGTLCSDGNGCTQDDTCQSGTCVSGSPRVCTADSCHTAGTCDPPTGNCLNPARPDGTACDDFNPCTSGEVCTSGVCNGNHVQDPPVGNTLVGFKSGGVPKFSWQNDGGTFDVYKGSIPAAPGTFSYDQSCYARHVSPPVTDSTAPPVGAGWYYLVSHIGACFESILGTSSTGAVIPNSHPCP